MDYSPEFINLLKDDPHIRRAIQDRNFTYIYEYLNVNIYRSVFTQFFYNELKINPLDYMDYVPELFLLDSPITDFIIPDNIKSIKSRAFDKCRSLTTIEIPNSVTSIGHEAFWGCSALTSVVIPDSVTDIGNYAFAWCTLLKSVKIGNNVTSIDYAAFNNCHSLTSVVIGKGVTSIGVDAFSNCKSLTDIVYKGSIKEFNTINKSSGWNYGVPATKVICADGVIEL